MTYCYIGLELPLEKLLQRDQTYSFCEQWRNRKVRIEELGDIYDGQIWKNFVDHDGAPYFSKPLFLAVMINIDWFQPYKYVQYSVGVIFPTLLNLRTSICT